MSLQVSKIIVKDYSFMHFALVGSGNEDSKKKVKKEQKEKKVPRKKPIISSDDSNDKVKLKLIANKIELTKLFLCRMLTGKRIGC
jgi:hypothetical protein